MDHDEEFTAYAAARWGALVRSGVGLGCTLEEAQDLAQTTLLRCLVSWRRVRRADDQDAYVYRVLLNCHRDRRRRRWWGEQPTEPHDATDPSLGVDAADVVRRALSDLTPALREVVVLRFYGHLSEAQIAAALGIAPGTVKSRMSRALARLSTHPQLDDLTGRHP